MHATMPCAANAPEKFSPTRFFLSRPPAIKRTFSGLDASFTLLGLESKNSFGTNKYGFFLRNLKTVLRKSLVPGRMQTGQTVSQLWTEAANVQGN
jgi:hypothetical protein